MASTVQASNQQAELREQLLSMENQKKSDDYLRQQFKTYSILIGLCYGVFVQLATLGSNFLLGVLCGDAITNLSDNQAMIFSLLWSFLTSFLALLILASVRAFLVNSILDANTSEDEYQCEEKRREREIFMMAIKVRYVVGALIGLCFAWTCTDLLLGMQSMALYSLCALVVAMAWSKTMIWCFTSRAKSFDAASEKVAYIVWSNNKALATY